MDHKHNLVMDAEVRTKKDSKKYEQGYVNKLEEERKISNKQGQNSQIENDSKRDTSYSEHNYVTD